jgi:hypothetical protein
LENLPTDVLDHIIKAEPRLIAINKLFRSRLRDVSVLADAMTNKLGMNAALCHAAESGLIELCDAIVSKYPDMSRNDAVKHAAANGHVDVCRMLLIREQDRNQSLLDCALCIAASKNRFAMCEFLVDSGAKDVRSGLCFAASSGSVDLCTYFIEKGAPVNHSSLVFAAAFKRIEVCKFMIEYGGVNLNETLNSVEQFGTPELVEFLTEVRSSIMQG